jgi:hypothetical protein
LKRVQQQPALAQEQQTVPRRPALGLRLQAQLQSLSELLPPVFHSVPWRARLLKPAQPQERAE